MKTLIISLPNQHARRTFQREQMSRLGLAYEFLDAVNAADMPEHLFAKWQGTWERPLRKAEVGCLLSHALAWSNIAQANAPALILEDDALLANTVPALLERLATWPAPMDLLTLEVRARKKVVSRQRRTITGDLSLVELVQDRTGTAGYVLWPSGARKLLDKLDKGFGGPSDAFISSHYALQSFQVEPAAVVQLDMCGHYGLPLPMQTTSSICSVAKPSKARGLDVFTYRRIRSQLRMGWRIVTALHRAQRRHVALNLAHFNAPTC